MTVTIVESGQVVATTIACLLALLACFACLFAVLACFPLLSLALQCALHNAHTHAVMVMEFRLLLLGGLPPIEGGLCCASLEQIAFQCRAIPIIETLYVSFLVGRSGS